MSHAREINKEIYKIKEELRNIQFHNQHMRLAACKLDALQSKKAKCALLLTSLSIFLWPLKKVALNAMSLVQGNIAVTAAATATATGTVTTATIIAVSPAPHGNIKNEISKPVVVIEQPAEIVKHEETKTLPPATAFTPKNATVIKLDGEQIMGIINNYTSDYITIETTSGLKKIEHKDIFKIVW